ncbi:MAG: N-acetylglucosaminyltransferase, partial [Ilumatobacteraceae bacterium]
MTRPKVIDAFPFNNEHDILECRLVELYDSVDAFVLVEATRDHQDHAKPLWYAEHAERFAPWADKIVHVV